MKILDAIFVTDQPVSQSVQPLTGHDRTRPQTAGHSANPRPPALCLGHDTGILEYSVITRNTIKKLTSQLNKISHKTRLDRIWFNFAANCAEI